MTSLGYYLLHMMNEFVITGKYIQVQDRPDLLEKIRGYKQNLTLKDLCPNPRSQVLKSYFEEVNGMQYQDRPFYSKLKHILTLELMKYK